MRTEEMLEEIQRLLDGGVSFYKTSSVGTSSYAASTVQNPSSFTLESLTKAKELLQENEAARIFMKKHGFDPDKGDRLFLPEACREVVGIQPDYVTFSLFIGTAVMVRGSLTEIPQYPTTHRFDWSLL